MPKVSVLLCAYNAEKYIAEAINSTIQQTYQDFEFIIVDDGSTDNTLQIINGYTDSRIRLIRNPHDYINSLNVGLKACQGKYVLRMDADDIMDANRIEEQVKVMDDNSDITVCTSWARTFGKDERIVGNIVQGKISDISTLFLLGNFLIHPSCMIRRRFLTRFHIKYKRYNYAEDFKLWTDIDKKGGIFYVIPHTLLSYRLSEQQVTHIRHQEQNATRLTIQQEIIEERLKHLNPKYKQDIEQLYQQTLLIHKIGLLSADTIVGIMYGIFKNLQAKT